MSVKITGFNEVMAVSAGRKEISEKFVDEKQEKLRNY